MSDNKQCDLCSLKVEVSGFELKTKEGTKHFCCEGCKGIFSLLNEDLLQAEPPKQTSSEPISR